MPKLPTSELTPEQRFQQVATILAKAVLRYQRHLRRCQLLVSEESSESSPGGLEVSGKTRLSVSRCIGG